MPVELLTLIALWCGNPIAPRTQFHIQYGTVISIEDVNQCRKELRSCMKQEIDKNSPMIAEEAFNIAADACTAQTSYPGKDN